MKITVTLLATILALSLGMILILYSGAYNVAASRPHSKIAEWAMSTAMEKSVRRHADSLPVPDLEDRARVRRGWVHFREMCVTCHGAPGVPRSEIGKGLNPEAPSLSEEAGEWTPAQLHWIVKHGIKMTGMPAFGETHSDEDLWSLVAFVNRLETLDSAGYASLASESMEKTQHSH